MRIGNQKPRIQIEPARADTDGAGAGLLMEAYADKLDEWQQLCVDSILGVDNAGNYVTSVFALCTPRQNGKNTVAEAVVLFALVNGWKVLWTAHQVRTTKKAHRRLSAIFEDPKNTDLNRLVKRIRHGSGEESIELANGGTVEFLSRSRQGARGFDGLSLLVMDEMQETCEEEMAALTATLAASNSGHRLTLMLGTPPYVGAPAEVFKRYRTACMAASERGEQTHNGWYEWSIDTEDPANIDVNNEDLWFYANPALNLRLTLDFTREEAKILSHETFLQERLGYWSRPTEERLDLAIDPALWDSCASDEEKPGDGKIAYGVKFTPDGSELALAGAIIPHDGTEARITLLAVEPTGNGLTWLANWLNERYKKASCVVIDGKTGSGLLVDKIKPVWTMKGTVIKPTATDMTTAASTLINELKEKSVTWYRLQEELRDSALTSVKRNIGGGFGFGGSNAAPIEAVSLALWGARNAKRDPGRVMRIG